MSLPSPESPLSTVEAERLVRDAVERGGIERAAAERLGHGLAQAPIRRIACEGARESKRRAKGEVVTVSRNVFIPLTNLCRDRCSYCTFAKPPESPEAKTYTLDEVAGVVRGGVATGCIEALFCLGDKPEVAYRSHREWLRARGFATTAAYLVEACRIAFEGGMLPHTNAGLLSQDEMAALRPWNASMGLMLETTSERLRGKGQAHYFCPDKEPKLRIRMHEEAGELGIPFTTGILLGIGETVAERIDTLLVMRDLHDRHGHIQEAIVQPFHPKPGTPMRAAASLTDDEFAGWVALSRLVLGPAMNVQAPPNLAPGALEAVLRAGINDWGGVSPVTVDFINPEAPWPTLRELRARTEAAGDRLRERLPVYPGHVVGRPDLFDTRMREALPRFADAEGFARSPIPPGGLARAAERTGQEAA
ncbi:MAG TPA: 7,8-didemethyl-8-hydroxy-5-deazariboflavin synthase CofG [Myxococcota bacterium]|nr:7,8-didemethyl-8-hydroxy-5-deazariboflavin synthase CofG [Myxococcota bacterium]